MTRIAIVVGSTRPGRRGRDIAEWVASVAAEEQPATGFEIVDLADFDLPLLDEKLPAMSGRYDNVHTRLWSEAIAGYDGFVFVTPEYNRSVSGALKNALDFLYAEWNDKAAGFVGYGVHGGIRAVEHLRLMLAELKVATVRTQVSLFLHDDSTPGARQQQTLSTLLNDVIAWSEALKPIREKVPA